MLIRVFKIKCNNFATFLLTVPKRPCSGIRSMITENGVTTEFMAFSGLVLSGYDKNGKQTEHYYYGNSLLAAEYVTTETSLYYNLKNSHGDVIGLTDTYSTLTETYRYNAFGTLISIQSV